MDRINLLEVVPVGKREKLLEERLKTHIIPIGKLRKSKPRKDGTKEERENNFLEFIEERAEEIQIEMEKICKLEFYKD